MRQAGNAVRIVEHTKEYAAFAGNPAAYNSEEHQPNTHADKLTNGSSAVCERNPERSATSKSGKNQIATSYHHVDLAHKDFLRGGKDLVYHLSDFHERTESGHRIPISSRFYNTRSYSCRRYSNYCNCAAYTEDVSYEHRTVSILRQHSASGFQRLI